MEYSELIQGFADRYGIAGLAAADGVATIEIDGLKVSLIHDDAADAVTIYGEVGFPPPDADGPFGGTMLKANHLFRGTGGAVLCQDPETGAYALFRVLPLVSLDLDALCAEIGKLVDQVENWKRLMEGFLEAEEAAEDAVEEAAEFNSLPGGGFMQV
jgi:hypothetical protein